MNVSPRSRREPERVFVGVIEVVALEHDLAAEIEHGLHLDVRRRAWHHYHGGDAAPARGQRHALCVVAGRRADHPAARGFVVEARDLVVGTAQLEGKDGLQVLALEQDVVAEPAAQAARGLQRRLDRDVVDSGLEDPFDVAFLHGSILLYGL